MSIKVKLSIIFSLLFSLILILNNTLHYLTTKEQLKQEQIHHTEMIAQQIVESIENYQRGSQQIEDGATYHQVSDTVLQFIVKGSPSIDIPSLNQT